MDWLWAVVVLLFVSAVIGYVVYSRIRRRVREYSRMMFGTDSIAEGVKKLENEAAVTPKSVSSATELYLPAIMKDFPEFHYEEMKSRAENVLTSYLRSVDGLDKAVLTEGTNELSEQLQMKIQMLKQLGQQEHFENIRIHKTAIHRYRKLKGRVSVIFQSSVEYVHYVESAGKVIKGRNDLQEQAKYNVEVIYVQDRDMIENLGDAGLGLNCPNCGAPLPSLGAKKCAYCDTPVIAFNICTWNFNRVEKK